MARLPLGQNTPLTLVGYFSGESGVNKGRDGITTTILGGTYITGGLQHERDGVGGEYALRLSTNQGFIFPLGGLIIRHPILFMPIWGESYTTVNFLRGGTDYQGGFEVLPGNALRIGRGESGLTFAEVQRTATGAIPEGQYNWASLEYFVANASGRIRFRLFSYNNLLLDFTGDTQASATFDNIDAVRVYAEDTTSDVRADDIFVFARSIYFNTAAGPTPAVGATITDVDTGATAVIDYIEVDGTDGVALVHTVVGTFEATDDLSSGAWSAVCGNHLGEDKASLWIPEGFIEPAYLDASFASGWSATNVPPEANWQQVVDWFDLTDYTFTDTPAVVDVYGTAPPSSLPVGSTIIMLAISTWGNNSSAVTQIMLGYNDGTADQEGPEQVLPSTAGRTSMLWTHNTRTGAAFTEAEISALRVRNTSVA